MNIPHCPDACICFHVQQLSAERRRADGLAQQTQTASQQLAAVKAELAGAARSLAVLQGQAPVVEAEAVQLRGALSEARGRVEELERENMRCGSCSCICCGYTCIKWIMRQKYAKSKHRIFVYAFKYIGHVIVVAVSACRVCVCPCIQYSISFTIMAPCRARLEQESVALEERMNTISRRSEVRGNGSVSEAAQKEREQQAREMAHKDGLLAAHMRDLQRAQLEIERYEIVTGAGCAMRARCIWRGVWLVFCFPFALD